MGNTIRPEEMLTPPGEGPEENAAIEKYLSPTDEIISLKMKEILDKQLAKEHEKARGLAEHKREVEVCADRINEAQNNLKKMYAESRVFKEMIDKAFMREFLWWPWGKKLISLKPDAHSVDRRLKIDKQFNFYNGYDKRLDPDSNEYNNREIIKALLYEFTNPEKTIQNFIDLKWLKPK